MSKTQLEPITNFLEDVMKQIDCHSKAILTLITDNLASQYFTK